MKHPHGSFFNTDEFNGYNKSLIGRFLLFSTSYGWLKYREYNDTLDFDDYNQQYQDALKEKNIPYLEMEAVNITDCS